MASETVAHHAEENGEKELPFQPSPFFYTSTKTRANDLAMLQLKRDHAMPVTLRTTADDGYVEGAVTNTRYGSFPHTTLMGLEWGSQVRASKVDTGTRGRKGKHAAKGQPDQPSESATVAVDPATTGDKRKPDDDQPADAASPTKKRKQQPQQPQSQPDSSDATRAPIEAGSGFLHILPPTPESWTMSLDHRTQVVYIPDYSYILHRLRARPGDTLIEAGAGSGSFTHAAARAVFNGYPAASTATAISSTQPTTGHVLSYEYHAPRVATLQAELLAHHLTPHTVHLTHADVYNSGFPLPAHRPTPLATAIFLDLPAPWKALKHLHRPTTTNPPDSPLHPTRPIHLCTFSPCIEQVSATVSFLRRAGWTSIEMVQVQNQRLDIRRERVGLREQGLRNAIAAPATVEEALERLREVDASLKEYHAPKKAGGGEQVEGKEGVEGEKEKAPTKKQRRLEAIRAEAGTRELWKEGKTVVRTEPEVKTHTSYLVFAVLPRVWGKAEEEAARARWG